MMKEQNHIIQKVNVEVDVPDLHLARRLYSNISDLIHTAVLPAVEAALDAVAADDYYRAEQVTIELFLPEATLQTQLAAAVGEEIKKQLAPSEKKKAAGGTNLPSYPQETAGTQTGWQKRGDVFISFLQTGLLSWHAGGQQWLEEDELLKVAESGDSQSREAWKKILLLPVSRQRLISQFSSRFVLRLTEILFAIPVSRHWQELKQAPAGDQTREAEKRKLATMLTKLASEDKKELIKELLEEWKELMAKGDDLKEVKTNTPAATGTQLKTGSNKKKEFLFEEEGIYVNNAGLILLHPFLQYFFKEFDLLNGDAFKDEAAQQTAIHLLHYLATGQQQPFEYDLLPEKYLCSFPLEEPLERFIILTDKMKEESLTLLKAVIHHWKTLKSTSPEGLQQGFLQRSGKLILQPHQHRLLVESHTIDILLGQLPWNHSIIRLPWMQQPLYIDWQTGYPQ